MPNGAKYWRLKYRWQGKEKSLALGVFPDTSLKMAREKRDEARRILANGTDPGERRKADKLAIVLAQKNSFEAIAKEWHKVKAAEWAPRHAQAVLKTLQTYLFPTLGKRPISEITAMELLTVFRGVESTGKLDTAKRLRERCNAIFRLAVISGRAQFNPAADLVGVMMTPISKPRPSLRQEELPRFFEAINSTEGMTYQTRLLFRVLMTCFTPSDYTQVRWHDVLSTPHRFWMTG